MANSPVLVMINAFHQTYETHSPLRGCNQVCLCGSRTRSAVSTAMAPLTCNFDTTPHCVARLTVGSCASFRTSCRCIALFTIRTPHNVAQTCCQLLSVFSLLVLLLALVRLILPHRVGRPTVRSCASFRTSCGCSAL